MIDIHGASENGDDTLADRDGGYTKGVMHCVLNIETCVRLAQNNVKAKTMKQQLQQLSSMRNETLSIMEKSAFECIGFEDKLVRVQFWSIPVIHDEIKENGKTGTNLLSDEEIREFYCFEEKRVPNDIDISAGSGGKMTNIDKVKESNKIGKSGYEVRRTGGSGGRTMNIVKDGLVMFLQDHQTGTP